MSDRTEELLRVIAVGDPLDVAAAYRAALYAKDVSWGTVNRAIIAKWSMARLRTIKDLAWDGDWPLVERDFVAVAPPPTEENTQ